MVMKILALITALVAGGQLQAASAQGWPQRTITLVHGFGAGGNADSVARVVAASLGETLGVSVVVEARPGAGGNLATETVSRAQPDGYTIILLTGGHAVSAALYSKLKFDPVNDFAFVSIVGTFPFVVATRADSPIKTMTDLLEAARREPGKLTFSSVGHGSTQHLTGELLAVSGGVKLTHVPYRGGMQPLTDLMSGRIDLMVDSITVTGSAIRSGTIRGIGISSAEAWPTLPEVPTIASTLSGFEVRSWLGIAAPAKTPPEIVSRLNDAVRRAVNDPGTRDKLSALGLNPEATSPEAMQAFVASEIRRWQEVVAKAGIEKL
jgi:tripartite-type tricarboxylate transporter receptor subunit TctC